MTKMNESLARRVEAMGPADHQVEIPVIVTLNPGGDPTALEQAGLRVKHRFEAVTAVAGTVTLGDLDGLTALAQVESVEYDAEVRALGTES